MRSVSGDFAFNYVHLVIGRNGSGKTTFISSEIKRLKLPYVVIAPDALESGRWPGCLALVPFEKGIFAKIWNFSLKNADKKKLIVFDDARTMLSSRDEGLLKLLRRRRQLNIGFFLVFHSLSETPPSIYTFVTHFTTFKTLDNPLKFRGKVPDYAISACLIANSSAGKHFHTTKKLV